MNYNLTKMFDAQKTSRKREIAKDECQICANKLTPSGATSAPATSETTSAISFNSSSGDCDVIDVENVVCQATPTVLRPIGAHYIPSKNKKKVSHFLTACARCFRHYELFAEKWPKRSPMAVLERSDILHEIAEEDEEEDEDEAAREEEIIKVCGKAVENGKYVYLGKSFVLGNDLIPILLIVDVPRIAWVRPTDSSKIWWPALLVPHRYNELCKEFNAVLKKNATLEDDQVMCIFFECPSM